MKKILFLIIVSLLIVEFREHPILKPYTDRIIGLVSAQAKKSIGANDFPKFLKGLEQLDTLIAPHEYSYLVNELTNLKKVEAFNTKQCSNIKLSHMTLTSYSIKKACAVIDKYLPAS